MHNVNNSFLHLTYLLLGSGGTLLQHGIVDSSMDHQPQSHGASSASSAKSSSGGGDQVNLPTPEMSPLENNTGSDREGHVGSSTLEEHHHQLLSRLTGGGNISGGTKGNPVMQLISKFDNKRLSPYTPRSSPFAQFHAAAAAAAAASQNNNNGNSSPGSNNSGANSIQHPNTSPYSHNHHMSPLSEFANHQQTYGRQMEGFYDAPPHHHHHSQMSISGPAPTYYSDQYGTWIGNGEPHQSHQQDQEYSPQHRITYEANMDPMQAAVNGMFGGGGGHHHYDYAAGGVQNDMGHGYPAMDANHNSFYTCTIKQEQQQHHSSSSGEEHYDTSSPRGGGHTPNHNNNNNNNNNKSNGTISINNNHHHSHHNNNHHQFEHAVVATTSSGSSAVTGNNGSITTSSSSLIYKALSEACDGAI